jgi:hypothetical protein
MERLTSRQTIKHSDGTEHIETYCHGHRYGPAAFPRKYGTSDPQDYKEYCEMVDRLAQYEDAEEEGRLVELDDMLALAMCAGARAIETNMNRMGKRYVYDVYKGVPNISYKEAAQILRVVAEKALEGESEC